MVNGLRMNAGEYVSIDFDVPTFNESNDDSEGLLVVDKNIGQTSELESDEEEKTENSEVPLKLSEAIELVQRLRLFSIGQYPQFHQAIDDIESKLSDIYLHSKRSVQTTIHSYFKKD